MKMKIQNAQIHSAFLGFEDHGIFAVNIVFEFEGFHQGTGCYALKDVSWLKNLLKTLSVDEWSQLKGKYVRIAHADDSFNSSIEVIGHITQNKWFSVRNGEAVEL